MSPETRARNFLVVLLSVLLFGTLRALRDDLIGALWAGAVMIALCLSRLAFALENIARHLEFLCDRSRQ